MLDRTDARDVAMELLSMAASVRYTEILEQKHSDEGSAPSPRSHDSDIRNKGAAPVLFASSSSDEEDTNTSFLMTETSNNRNSLQQRQQGGVRRNRFRSHSDASSSYTMDEDSNSREDHESSSDEVEVSTSLGGLADTDAPLGNKMAWSTRRGKAQLAKQVNLDDLRPYFHLPIIEVAKIFGICTTLLKKICRRNRIKRWPHRQLLAVSNSIQSLETASKDAVSRRAKDGFKRRIAQLQEKYLNIKSDASVLKPISPSAKDVHGNSTSSAGELLSSPEVSCSPQQSLGKKRSIEMVEGPSGKSPKVGDSTSQLLQAATLVEVSNDGSPRSPAIAPQKQQRHHYHHLAGGQAIPGLGKAVKSAKTSQAVQFQQLLPSSSHAPSSVVPCIS